MAVVTAPFDVILLSTIYGFFHVIGNRRSYQNRIRGHIYPTAVASLPWNDALKADTSMLREIGERVLDACEKRYDETTRLATEASALGLKPLKEVVRAIADAKLIRSESFVDEPVITIELDDIEDVGGAFVLSLNAENTHTVTFNREDVARLVASGLALREGTEATWSMLLQVPIPVSSTMADELDALHRSFDRERVDSEIASEIERLDFVVGRALGLTSSDVWFVRREMEKDPFLARVRPRYPFFVPRQQGRRKKLERKDRYSG